MLNCKMESLPFRQIEEDTNADDSFSECLVNLIDLAYGSLETFRGSNVSGKHRLINFVFSNLQLKGYRLEFKLRPPFDQFTNLSKMEEWLLGPDSNQRPNG